jgi:8-oxo-dGTP diphosphatase
VPDTNRWTRCSRGHRHWGSLGAAGLLLIRRAPTGAPDTTQVLLQHRAGWVHHGDTWSVPGGAIHTGETPWDAALREVLEETGLDLADAVELWRHVDDHGGWSYTTVIARTRAPALPRALTPETLEVRWVPVGELAQLPLHPGFAATWERVRSIAQASNAAGSTVTGNGSTSLSGCPGSARPTST